MIAKKYKAIFGNPPFSLRGDKPKGTPKLLWNRFAESSIEMADEVYYITPFIWNGSAKKCFDRLNGHVDKVDLGAGNSFDGVYSPICYWSYKKRKVDGCNLYLKEGVKVELGDLNDIRYIPLDANNTLSIHRRVWDSTKSLGLWIRCAIDWESTHIESSEEQCYKVFSTGRYKLRYTNERVIERYSFDLYSEPKILIGFMRDNDAFYDRVGEYATIAQVFILTGDNLDIRYKQLTSSFARFWFATSRQDMGDSSMVGIYRAAARAFPDIPLHITDDHDIYEWLGVSSKEIEVIERYAAEAREQSERRNAKYCKKVTQGL